MPASIVVASPAPGAVGPGYITSLTCSGQPVQATDFIEGNLIEHASGIPKLISAMTVLSLSSAQQFIWGWTTTTQFGRAGNVGPAYAQGAGSDLVFNWRDHLLNIIATVTSLGWTYDSVNQAWYLASLALWKQSAPGGILPSLSSTYHNNP